ncbi:MAG: seg [Candidatus Adlerbacteria bacterium]|nr:seg [Candidatus Adlerbacteria bacterium]
MSDNTSNFHTFALQSGLFKGHDDWYFCYLKSERIAHVLAVLAQSSPHPDLDRLIELASSLPESIVYFAASEVVPSVLLAEVFVLLSAMRLSGTKNLIRQENVSVLISELQHIAQLMGNSSQVSPFVTAEDFAVPFATAPDQIPKRLSMPPTLAEAGVPIKDIYKGHLKRQAGPVPRPSKDQEDRAAIIRDFVLSNKGVSIKDISKVVRNCSEKTIQRELGALIQQGLVKKIGERRWSVYVGSASAQ